MCFVVFVYVYFVHVVVLHCMICDVCVFLYMIVLVWVVLVCVCVVSTCLSYGLVVRVCLYFELASDHSAFVVFVYNSCIWLPSLFDVCVVRLLASLVFCVV